MGTETSLLALKLDIKEVWFLNDYVVIAVIKILENAEFACRNRQNHKCSGLTIASGDNVLSAARYEFKQLKCKMNGQLQILKVTLPQALPTFRVAQQPRRWLTHFSSSY